MAAEELAFHYIIVFVWMALSAWICLGFLSDKDYLMGAVKGGVLRIPTSVPNPLVWTRASYVSLGFPVLSFRVVKRFSLKYGFKLVFLSAFLLYTWNVWTETLADDPFTIVGVSPSASASQIRRACRQGSLKLHPDKHPGQEEQIRPKFEKHTRACKLLNDPKLKEKYIKWGALPKRDQKDGEAAAAVEGGVSMNILQVGGGSYLLSAMVYLLLLVGTPAYILDNVGDYIYDDAAQLESSIADCKALSEDMKALYKCAPLSSLFLDLAELYLVVAQAEYLDAKARAASAPRTVSSLNSLLTQHQARFYTWKAGNPTLADAEKMDAKSLKLDKAIATSSEALDKRSKGSGKAS